MRTWKILVLLACILCWLFFTYNLIMFIDAVNNIGTLEMDDADPILEAIFGPILGVSIFTALATQFLSQMLIFGIPAIVLTIIFFVY